MSPNILHEGQHTGEFLVSEANGTLSRETGALAQRPDRYLDGTILVRQSTTEGDIFVDLNDVEEPTGGPDYSEVAGILYGNYDASGGNVEAVMISRLAEVKDANLRYPEGADKDAIVAALEALDIRPR